MLSSYFSHMHSKKTGRNCKICTPALHKTEFALQLTVQKAPSTSDKDKVGVWSIQCYEKRTGNNLGREEEGKLAYCEGTAKEADRIIHGKIKTVMFLHLVEHNLINTHCKHEGKTTSLSMLPII